jgi:hypothetical protein
MQLSRFIQKVPTTFILKDKKIEVSTLIRHFFTKIQTLNYLKISTFPQGLSTYPPPELGLFTKFSVVIHK